jgi:hypothetical protein
MLDICYSVINAEALTSNYYTSRRISAPKTNQPAGEGGLIEFRTGEDG